MDADIEDSLADTTQVKPTATAAPISAPWEAIARVKVASAKP